MAGIEGSVALVTGAAQGIGRAIALRLARDGADIAVVDVNEAKVGAVAKEVAALGRKATPITADVSDRDQVHAAVRQARGELGSLEIMSTTPASFRSSPSPRSPQRGYRRSWG